MYIVMVANSSIVASPSHKLLLQLFFAQVLMSEFLKFIPNIIVLWHKDAPMIRLN